jgi:Tfp pilus assembly protein PilF
MVGMVFFLGACAQMPTRTAMSASLWRDQAFDYDPALVTVGKQQLFRLDDALLTDLHNPTVQSASTDKRMAHLINLLFDPKTRTFNYGAGQTRTASETWASKRGDCLSFTVLAFTLARELKLPALMQEVPVPVMFDRHGGLDYLNGHVNVFIKEQSAEGIYTSTFLRPGTILDFEPQAAAPRLGQALSDDEILARYYNNIAVDHLARGQYPLAYAHFKAAIQTDPSFSPSFSNLALLYQRAGLASEAEQLLRHAVVMTSDGGVPMRSLHQLLVSQGRLEEAAKYQAMLRAMQEKDPYYWIGLGAEQMRQANYRGAIESLEKAQKLAVGFAEIHRYLAVAYSRVGKPSQAQNQLAALTDLNREDPYIPVITNKLQRIADGKL